MKIFETPIMQKASPEMRDFCWYQTERINEGRINDYYSMLEAFSEIIRAVQGLVGENVNNARAITWVIEEALRKVMIEGKTDDSPINFQTLPRGEYDLRNDIIRLNLRMTELMQIAQSRPLTSTIQDFKNIGLLVPDYRMDGSHLRN